MNIPQAARELTKSIFSQSVKEWGEVGKLLVSETIAVNLITAALKRCRNEALEEAIEVCEKDADKFHAPDRISGCLWSAAGIKALKEAE